MRGHHLLIPLLITGLLLTPSLASPLQTNPTPLTTDTIGAEQYQGATRYNTQGWINVQIHGTPYQRGYQHGYLLSREIQDTIQRWTNTIHNYPHLQRLSQHLTPDRYTKMSNTWWTFASHQVHKLYWDKWPQEYIDEINGIADGATAHGARIFNRPITPTDILSINEMYEWLSKMERIPKHFHPFKILFHQLRQIIPEMQTLTDDQLLDAFFAQDPAHHCNGFIATGNATSHGQIVIGHGTIAGGTMWWWNYYTALRWNVILDITPSEGHRFQITTSPGYIWSDEDFYQNDNGITFLETTVPQGPYDNLGIPLSIRCRTAIQYGNSVDEVLHTLQYRSDGCMNAVWLIGDTKTGEIARLDLGYQHAQTWRTFNGFFWSANNPMNTAVRLEKFWLKKYVSNLLGHFVGYPGLYYWTFHYHPEERDAAFKAFGDSHYGHIDVENVKTLMLLLPISEWTTDSKVSDTDLILHHGLWAFFGNPNHPLVMTSFDQPIPSTEVITNTGWDLVYGRPQYTNTTLVRQPLQPTTTGKLGWSTFLGNQTNLTQGTVADGVLYWMTSSGELYAVNATTGMVLWQQFVGRNPTAPTIINNTLYIGWTGGVSAVTTTGTSAWTCPLPGRVLATPILVGGVIVVGDSTGNITALNPQDGVPRSHVSLPGSVLVGSGQGDTVFVTCDSSCVAVSLSTGRVYWRYQTGAKVTVPPVLVDGTVYVASWDTKFYAINAVTGLVQWFFTAGWGFNAPLRVDADRIYAACMDNSVYVLNHNGALVWNVTTTASIQTTPAVHGAVVVIGSDDGRLYAVNRSSGSSVWWFTPADAIIGVKNYHTTPLHSSIIADEGMVFLGVNGSILALNLTVS